MFDLYYGLFHTQRKISILQSELGPSDLAIFFLLSLLSVMPSVWPVLNFIFSTRDLRRNQRIWWRVCTTTDDVIFTSKVPSFVRASIALIVKPRTYRRSHYDFTFCFFIHFYASISLLFVSSMTSDILSYLLIICESSIWQFPFMSFRIKLVSSSSTKVVCLVLKNLPGWFNGPARSFCFIIFKNY